TGDGAAGSGYVIICLICGVEVFERLFCIVCGASLAFGDAHYYCWFAAVFYEAAFALRFALMMLLWLFKVYMAVFNISLLVGIAVVVLIAVLGYYLLALGAGVFIVLLLFVVYIYDVDDYKNKPIKITTYTLT